GGPPLRGGPYRRTLRRVVGGSAGVRADEGRGEAVVRHRAQREVAGGIGGEGRRRAGAGLVAVEDAGGARVPGTRLVVVLNRDVVVACAHDAQAPAVAPSGRSVRAVLVVVEGAAGYGAIGGDRGGAHGGGLLDEADAIAPYPAAPSTTTRT